MTCCKDNDKYSADNAGAILTFHGVVVIIVLIAVTVLCTLFYDCGESAGELKAYKALHPEATAQQEVHNGH